MNLFATDGRITKYDTPEDILDAFCEIRQEFYDRRKEMLVFKLRREQRILSNKARFVVEVCNGELIVSNRRRTELLNELNERGYETFLKENNREQADTDEDEKEASYSDSDLAKGYDFLLSMKIWTLTFEKASALQAELEVKTAELEELEATEPTQLWLRDLDAIEAALDERDLLIEASAKDEKRAQAKSQKHAASKAAKKNIAKGRKTKTKNEWNSELEESSDSDVEMMSSAMFPSKKTLPAARKGVLCVKAPRASATKREDALSTEGSLASEIDISKLLSQQMEEKLGVSPAKPRITKKQINPKKRPSPKSENQAVDLYSSSDDDIFKLETDIECVPASIAKKKSTTTTVAVKRNKPASKPKKAPAKTTSDSEDDCGVLSVDEESGTKKKLSPKASRSRRAVAKKPVKYDFGESDDSGSEFDF